MNSCKEKNEFDKDNNYILIQQLEILRFIEFESFTTNKIKKNPKNGNKYVGYFEDLASSSKQRERRKV